MAGYSDKNKPDDSDPRAAHICHLLTSLPVFLAGVHNDVPRIYDMRIQDKWGVKGTVKELCDEVVQLCISMTAGDIVGPQPKIVRNLTSLARHFNKIDAGVDAAPLYRMIEEAYQAGLTDRDVKSAERRHRDWMEGRGRSAER